MEFVPRGVLRWTLIVGLVIVVVSFTAVAWGALQTFIENEHHLVELLLEARK